MNELETDIKNLLNDGNKIFGDDFIGYRIQSPSGKYLDSELSEIYETHNCSLDCTGFNKICDSLKSGDHNW
jgi:hypothetical protein